MQWGGGGQVGGYTGIHGRSHHVYTNCRLVYFYCMKTVYFSSRLSSYHPA